MLANFLNEDHVEFMEVDLFFDWFFLILWHRDNQLDNEIFDAFALFTGEYFPACDDDRFENL